MPPWRLRRSPQVSSPGSFRRAFCALVAADFRQIAKQLTVRRPPFDLRFGSTLDHALMTPQPFKRSVIH
jgi:hypothetical protein